MLLAPFSAGFTLRGGPYAVRAPIDPALLTARPRTARVAMDLDERPPRGLGGRRRQLTGPEEVDEFLLSIARETEEAEVLLSQLARTERRVLDRFIRLARNAEAVLKTVRRRHDDFDRLPDSPGRWRLAGKVAPLRQRPRQRRPQHVATDAADEREHADGAAPPRRLVSQLPEWAALEEHVRSGIEPTHLRELLADEERSASMIAEHEGILLDYSRQRVTAETMRLLIELARATDVEGKIQAMVRGERINLTERRPALHTALRAPRGATVEVDGVNVVDQVHEVRARVDAFAERVRSGAHRGATGKLLKNVVVVGIGGSSLGPAFLYEALKATPLFDSRLGDRQVRFLANIDEVDTARAIARLDAAETLVVVTSKTFTTRETLINACTLRQWLVEQMGWEGGALASHITRQHIVACTGDVDAATCWGVAPELAFPFWDWVGGRYSVTSCVGQLPIALAFGSGVFDQFLDGCHAMDAHFASAPAERNLPVLLGLLGVWNANFLGYRTRALFPYCEALWRLPSHIQQVDMESNGKRVTSHGDDIDYFVGEVDFGEPGTTGQHSFFQLMHMGQVVPADFLGFIESPLPSMYHETVLMEGAAVSHHDELMANFFAQPDALACGLSAEQLRAMKVPDGLVPHRTFPGNRPSNCLLVQRLTPYSAGQILALYEHRTAVQGFIWDINSFDQWGVELGKTLATGLRKQIRTSRATDAPPDGLNPSTARLLARYLQTARPAVGRDGAAEGEARAREQWLEQHATPRPAEGTLPVPVCVSDDPMDGCALGANATAA